MSILLRFILAMILAVIAIILAIMLGDYGPWYLAWVLGTGLMVLAAALGAVLFEQQEDAARQTEGQPVGKKPPPPRELEY